MWWGNWIKKRVNNMTKTLIKAECLPITKDCTRTLSGNPPFETQPFFFHNLSPVWLFAHVFTYYFNKHKSSTLPCNVFHCLILKPPRQLWFICNNQVMMFAPVTFHYLDNFRKISKGLNIATAPPLPLLHPP